MSDEGRVLKRECSQCEAAAHAGIGHICDGVLESRKLRMRLRDRLDFLIPGDRWCLIPPIPSRVAEWVREWINNAPVEELEQWHFSTSWQDPGVRFERYIADRNDSVDVTERAIIFHIADRDDIRSRDRKGAWLEVAFDPPHEVIEYLPSREEATR